MADDTSSDSDIEECGIKQPTLLQQIKTILDEYRNDVQIIKELVQNADDAEASKMGILYQGERTNEHGLSDLKFGKFLKAPALIFYNDAEFTAADWVGIKAIYSSVKKDDPLKIGRFGLGFKSVFHMTDNPCIVSGENVLFLNPHERHPDKVCTTVRLKAWNKSKYRGYVDVLTGTFGFSEETIKKGRYPGTLFWFTLRKTQSSLSENTYGEPEVLNLLQAFIHESNKSLLFLKTLCSVRMYVSLPETEGASAPKRRKLEENEDFQTVTDLEQMNFGKDTECYSVTITNASADLVVNKFDCLRELKEIGHTVPEESMQWSFDVTVTTERKSKTEDVKVARARWFILNYLKGGDISERTKELMKDEDLRYLHLVGLAAPINENSGYKNDAGQVFCYQPLPHDTAAMTRLPVHLNAFFALSQNRRQIRWPDQDDTTHALGDKKIEWNIALASEMFPEAYQKLVLNLVEISKREGNPDHLINAVYNSVPNLEIMEAQWKDLAERYISSCQTDAMLYTEKENGKWINTQVAVFADFGRFPDVGKTCQQTVLKLLLTDKVNVITVPEHVTKSIDFKHSDLRFVTPGFVKYHMENFKTYKSLSLDQKQDLLEFVLLESSRDSLESLELLPLADNTFVSFSSKEQHFLENQDIIDLFPGKETNFVLTGIRPKSKELLSGLVDTGKHGVHRLTDDAVVAFVQDILSNKGNREKVIWKPMSEVGNWMPWIINIWNLIQSRFKTSGQKFVGLPIYPVVLDYEWVEMSQLRLLPLESSILHSPSLRKLDDKEYIFRSFNHLSVTMTDKLPEWLDYSLVQSFLPDDTSEGLISLFAQISDEDIVKFNSESSDAEAAALLKFVSERIHSDVNESKQIFQKLKLFRGHTSENDYRRVSLKECNRLYTGNHFPVPFPERMINTKCDTEVSFAKRLDVVSLSESEVVKNALNNIENLEITQKQHLIRWIIKEDTHFRDDAVRERMKQIKFLHAADGNLYEPCELFDTSDKLILDLFQDVSVIPLLNENDHQFAEGLQKLGLKSRDHLTSKDIENVCSDVQEMYVRKNEINETKCSALLLIMDEKPHLVNKEKIIKLNCIMVKKINSDTYPSSIPLKNNIRSTTDLCFPSEVKSSEFLHLVGSVMYTINCESLPQLCKLFAWQTQPTVDSVLKHLSNVVRCFKLAALSTCLTMIVKIYEWLALQYERGTDNILQMMKDEFGSPNEKCIWVGDGFQSAKHVYIEENEGDIEDLKPFLHKLPTGLCSFSQFFVGIGCRSSLDKDMYLNTLYRIKEESETREMSLSHSKLRKLAVAILNKLNEEFADEVRENKTEIFFPVLHEEKESLIMKPTKQCTFCDAQWLKDMDFEMDEEIYYVHPEVPVTTAETLGVPSLRQQMLSNTEAFEEWGQEEPLTRRLRNLLKDGYVDGFSVAKELFQNADDAGATKLFILYDERENNDAKTQLISDGMADCQGPAIWVYNDAKFTEEDFRNITKLSGGTKSTDSTKIGKFGLGFCAVYNVTDVPSFVSGDNVVIFDPHTTFLGKALPGKNPGLRINFQVLKNLKMMKRLKNQFKPFDRVLSCRLTESASPSIDGTLFRLPLRNKASEISDTVYSTSEVKELFQKIMEMASNMLLFNQNVKELKLFHLPKSEKDPLARKLFYKADKENIKIMSDTEFLGPILVEVSKRKQEKLLAKTPLLLLERVTITVHTSLDCQAPFSTVNQLTKMVSSWIVSWSTGSSEKSLQLTYDESGAISLGAVAVPVKFGDTDTEENNLLEINTLQEVPNGFYKMGHLFFFLPLPIQHSFPFHVNSQFAVTTDRRRLQMSTEDDKNVKIKHWNESLFNDPITRALLFLLVNLHRVGSLHEYVYSQLWPRNERDETLRCLQQSFYQNVTSPGIYNVFEKDGNWFDVSKCVFVESDFRKSSVGDVAFEILSSLTKFVINIPDDLYSLLLDANRKLIQEKSVSEESFFVKYFLPNLERFQTDELMIEKRNQLLRYAITLETKSIKDWLKAAKCIPSQPHGLLQRPMDLVDPGCKLAGLFSVSDGRFPMEEFAHYLLGPLQDLGLMTIHLPDNIVIERAQSIQTLFKQCSACSALRAGYMLGYLCDNMSKHDAIKSELQDNPIFPVKCKPSDWRLKWFADGILGNEQTNVCTSHSSSDPELPPVAGFIGASSIFHNKSKNLVGCVQPVFEEGLFSVSGRVLTEDKKYKFLRAVGMEGLQLKFVDTAIAIKQLEAVASYGYQSSGTSTVLRDIYSHFENACTDLKNHAKIQQLKHKQIVNIHMQRTFAYPKDVARDVYRDCKPYFYQLADSFLRDYPSLCDCLGIVPDFDPSIFAVRLQDIKQQKGDEQLSPDEISITINMLTCFVNGMSSRKNLDTIIGDKVEAIFGPDENGILRDCRTMCFNDFDEIEQSETMIYVHEDFTPRLAKRLGVKPKAIHNLEEHSEDIEDFYQEEPLVTRLQRLVEGYPCDSGIFKELLQNADDAKATEIIFLKDYIDHPKNNIVDTSFEPLQGPALCVFNNSAFSNDDLKGIQRLGRGSKSDDPSQTGRYGVGFNAVYNLTDAPSFYSKGGEIENGETICFFDPLAKYVPKVTRRKPGKRYKNVKSIRRHHGDMISGYHEHLFLSGQRGTVFRFPLRTADMAKSSDIKQESVDMDTVSKFLDLFCNELGEVVLFLKNLKKVKVLTHSSNGYEEDYCISIQMTDRHQNTKNELAICNEKLYEAMKSSKENVLQFQQTSFIYEITLTEQIRENVRKSKYIVVQTVGFKKDNAVHLMLRQEFLRGKIGLSPHGGVAFYAGDNEECPENFHWDHDTKCKSFCFLPLPIHTGLPVHVHGYFCLDHESRRSLWKAEAVESCYRTLWNNALIKLVIAPAYVTFLKYMKEKMFQGKTGETATFISVSRTLTNYQSLFPVIGNITGYYWTNLLRCVYKELVKQQVSFLPSQEVTVVKPSYAKYTPKTILLSWTPFTIVGNSFPPYIRKESNDDPNNDESNFNTILRKIGMRIIFVKEDIARSMKVSKVDILPLCPKKLIEFVCTFNSGILDKCKIETGKQLQCSVLKSVEDVTRILEFCLQDRDYCFSRLSEIPLMITQDNIVRTLQDTEHFYIEPTDRFCHFFPSKISLFLQGPVAKLLHNNYKTRLHEVPALHLFDLQEFISLVDETGIIQDRLHYHNWDRTEPNEQWIRRFWEFFSYLLRYVQPENERDVVCHKLQSLRSLPLIPAVEDASKLSFLVPPCDLKRLIDLNSFSFNLCLRETFAMLDILQVDKTLIRPNTLLLLNKLVPNSSYPQDVVECLHINKEKLHLVDVSKTQASTMLRFFSDSVNIDNHVPKIMDKLKDLPLFESSFGELVALSKYRDKVVLGSDIPKEGLKELAEKANILLLCDTGINNLFKGLGIKCLVWTEVYENFILPHQAQLPRSAFYKHLEFLSEKLPSIEFSNSCLIYVLKNLDFIETLDERRVKASELFDPAHEVFKNMCERSELVPECLRGQKMLKLFRRIGLKDKMTMQLFELFARKVEAMWYGKAHFKDISKKSELLVRNLFEMNNEFFRVEVFDELKTIKFITPFVVDRNLSAIHRQFNSQSLICFDQSILKSSEYIAWTVGCILPEEADPTKQKPAALADIIIDKLSICREPDFQSLLQHCINTGKSLTSKMNSNQEVITTVMTSIYKALDNYRKSGQLTEETASTLENVPLIYFSDTKNIHIAKTVVNTCRDEEEIQPFLNKCPSSLAHFQNLFLVVGAKKEPSCEVYISVLNAVKNQSGCTTRLLPKESSDSRKAMEHLFKYLTQKTTEIKVLENHVCLLSENETLDTARKLVFANNTYYKQQLERNANKQVTLLFPPEKLQGYKLKLEDFVDSLQYLPQKHRPHLLTDLVRERINMANIVHKDGKIANELEAFFHSRCFVNGFLRLIRHAYRSSNIHWNSQEELRLIKMLENTSFQHVSGINTTLALMSLEDGEESTESLIENTEESKSIHLEVNPDKVCIFFDTSYGKWFSNFTKQFTIYLNGLVGKCLKDENLMMLMEMIGMKDSPETISLLLSKEKIEEYQTGVDINESPAYPIPGTFVPTYLHHYLDNNYGAIHEYDYKFIAFEIEDPAMEDADENNDEDHATVDADEDEIESDTDPTYIYIHIIRKLERISELPLLQEYEIDDGSENLRIVRAYQLYKFVRKNDTSSDSTKEVMVYKRTFADSSNRSSSMSLNEAYNEVKKNLREAWTKPEIERRKIVKRLLLKWHPDKNPNNVEFCTKVFQYIQQCLVRLENGQELIDDDDKTDTSNWSSSWSGRYWNRHYRRSQWSGRRNSSFNCFDEYWSSRKSYTYTNEDEEPYHWYSEARRWMKQAVSDLTNAKSSILDTANHSCNWICYKAHQAAEKSLKAAWYAENANKLRRVKYSHNISSLASGLCSDILPLANRLSAVAGDHSRMRYPDMFSGQQIPAEAYTRETAQTVINIAEDILTLVQSKHIK